MDKRPSDVADAASAVDDDHGELDGDDALGGRQLLPSPHIVGLWQMIG